MTVIVGMSKYNQVVVAADTLAEGGLGERIRSDKLLALPVGNGYAILGTSGDIGGRSLAKAHLKLGIPDPNNVEDLDAWAQAAAEAWTEIKADAARTPEYEGEGTVGLLAYAERLWIVHENMALPSKTAAVGCGKLAALGALDALKTITYRGSLESEVQIAVESAIEVCIGCGPPVVVMKPQTHKKTKTDS